MKVERRVLGLDLGTKSIGWCLISESQKSVPTSIIALGSRVFPDPLEDKTRVPLNQQRRKARLTRRGFQRRARRRAKLLRLLVKNQLLPVELLAGQDSAQILNQLGRKITVEGSYGPRQNQEYACVYWLRSAALKEKLSLHEIGKILLSFASRRGFLSNKKTLLGNLTEEPEIQIYLHGIDQKAASGQLSKEQLDEEKSALQEIMNLEAKIQASGQETLGAYLHQLGPRTRKRGLRTARSMYAHEFEKIWTSQAVHHPDVLTDALKKEVHHCIFYQRAIKFGHKLRGRCSLEPQRYRCSVGTLEAQEFRIWQDINHLQTIDPHTGQGHPLSEEERQRLFEALHKKTKMAFPTLRKLLKTKHKFNLEHNKVKELKGNLTWIRLEKAVPNWKEMDRPTQLKLVEDLLSIRDKRGLYRRLRSHWSFNVETAFELATLDLPSGYASLSRKAIVRLLPHLAQGARYDQARIQAGYGYDQPQHTRFDSLPTPPPLKNPVVERVMHQLRHLINRLIKTYGAPDAIRVEMSRDLAMSKRQKDTYIKQQKKNKQQNDHAKREYAAIRQRYPELNLPERPSHYHLLKYRLYLEAKQCCVYSGRQIGMVQVFSEETEIDHILPYQRSMDDSYMNKVLVFREENAKKSDRTPYEYFTGDTERYEQVKQLVRPLPYAKQKRMFQTNLDTDQRIGSMLNDTRYIAREAIKYVGNICTDVSVSKGQTTAMLRHRWGLNSLLGTNRKNRADHRHHAIDAAVIAVTSRSLYQHIVQQAKSLAKLGYAEISKMPIAPPWESFRQDLHNHIQACLVSRMPNQRIKGALHEETVYGLRRDGQSTEQVVLRRRLDKDFKKSDIDKIIDPSLREIVREYIARKGPLNEDGVPLPNEQRAKRAKVWVSKSFNPNSYLVKETQDGSAVQLYKLGNNHHVEIVRDTKTQKWTFHFRSMFTVAENVRRRGLAPVETDHGPTGELVMVLHIHDYVLLSIDGQDTLYYVRTLDPAGNRIKVQHHTSSGVDQKEHQVRKSISTLLKDFKMRKVRINILGQLMP